MKTSTKTALAVLTALALVPAAALAAPMIGDSVGTTLEDATTSLQSAGYEVREIERDDDELEVVILAAGQLLELEISSQTGMITGIELEDDDDDMSESAD